MRTLDPQKNLAQRSKIIACARTLFAEQGFAETSMLEIGRASNLTKPGLYHYFPGKDAILSEMFKETWASVEDQVGEMPKGMKLKDLLVFSGKKFIQHMDDPRNFELLKITVKEIHRSELVRRDSIFQANPRMDRHLLAIFGPAFPKGTSTKIIRITYFQFFGALFYYLFMDKMFGLPKELPSGREEYVRSLAEVFSKVTK